MSTVGRMLLLLALVALTRTALSISCPVSTCHPDDPNLPQAWLNTTSMGSKIRGMAFTTYPMTRTFPNVFTGASATLDIYALQELQPHEVGKCDKKTSLPYLSSQKANILRELDLSKVCCEVVSSWDMIEPFINRTTASVLVTDPLAPDFLLAVNFSLVNESVSYRRNGSINTGNNDYYESYSQYAAKITIDMKNWPWVAKGWANGTSNPSYLKFFILGAGLLEVPGNVTFWDAGITAHYYATSSRSYIEMNFLRVFTADGVDYCTSLEAADRPQSFYPDIAFDFFNSSFTIAACQEKDIISPPYYTQFTYDPSMSALFVDSEAQEAPETKSKRSLHPAAYIVPVVVIIVALVLAGIFILSPTARATITGNSSLARIPKPHDISDLETDAQSQQTRNTASETDSTATNSSSAGPERATTFERAQPAGRAASQSSASWMRSSKIPQ